MILKGSQRGGAQALALHLLNDADNDHVEVHAVNGFMAGDVEGALQEINAIARATNCKQFMFSLSLSPPQDALVTDQDFLNAIEQAMQKLGLTAQPHVVIFHEKNARRHCHVVISRIDTDAMKAINLPFFKERLCELSRELYLTHGWDMPKGHEDRAQSDPLNHSLEEAQVAKRAKRDPKAVKALLQTCWAQSDSAASFASALQEHGFALAKGDRRGFVAVDADGNIYSLSRCLGVKTKELKARLGDPALLPDVETAKQHLNSQAAPFDPLSQQQKLAEFDAKMATLTQQKDRLKDAQRNERFGLRDKHNAQKHARIAELRRATSGLIGLWNWAQRNRKRLVATHKAVLDALDEQAQLEMLRLSKQQRDTRRILQDKLTTLQNWRDQMLGHPAQPTVEPTVDEQFDPEELRVAEQVRQNPEAVLTLIGNEKIAFTRNDIQRRLSKYIVNPTDLQTAVKIAVASDQLVLVQDGATPKYATKEMVTLESQMMDLAKGMAKTKAYGVSPGHLKSAIQRQNKTLQKTVGANLSDEQRRAITHLVNRRQLSAVIGLAGSGKSTMLSAARDAWEKQGYRVIGAALAGKAADGLQNASGIPSRTLASYEFSWKNGRNLLQAGDVLVVDEAGMIGSRQLAYYIDETHKRGAKLVLVGDPEQLQPINAGTPFRDITDKIGCAELTEIRRQKSEWQRQASYDLARGHVAEAFSAYKAHGAVHTEATHDAAMTALIEDYMADLELYGAETSRLALAHRRVDVKALNDGIRLARKSAGDLQDEIIYETDHGLRGFAPGDRILFARNDAQLGVKNGMLGTVSSVTEGQIDICLDITDGSRFSRKLSLRTACYAALDHGYATTIHKSQGSTVETAFTLSTPTMDSHLRYVAFTRHKKQLKIYEGRTQTIQSNACPPLKTALNTQLFAEFRESTLEPEL